MEHLIEDLRPTLRGLDLVRVKKEALIEIITQNRDEHRQIFEEAIDGWHKQVTKKLAEMVEQAKKGPEFVELAVALPRPEDHTKDYNRILKMLELSQDEEMELDEGEFAKYVMDDWGWQSSFLTTSSNYSMSATKKLNRK